MTRTLKFTIITGLFFVSGCDMPDSTAVIDSRIPPTIIEASIAPDKFDMGSVTSGGSTVDVTIKGYVNVTDDNGLNDIANVRYTVFTPEGKLFSSGVLTDLGNSPDAAAADGKYTSNILLTLAKDVFGTYTVQYISEDKEGYVSNTFNIPLTVIYSANHPPTVSNFVAPDTIYVPASGNGIFTTSVRAFDAEGASDLTSVTLSIIRAEDSTVVGVYKLFDDGGMVNVPPFTAPSGDSLAGDNRYTLRFPVPFDTRKDIDRYFNVFATDQSGAVSNTISKKVVFR